MLPQSVLPAIDIFQQWMQSLFVNMPTPPIIYIDDLFCHSNCTFAKHLEIVDTILTCLKATGMQINAQMTSWVVQKVEVLGFLLETDEYKPLPSLIQGIVELLPPKNVKQVRQFWGMVNFMKNHIPCKTEILVPIAKLTKKNQPWVNVTKSICLVFSKLNIPFHLYMDACAYHMGAMLVQKNGVIGFFS